MSVEIWRILVWRLRRSSSLGLNSRWRVCIAFTNRLMPSFSPNASVLMNAILASGMATSAVFVAGEDGGRDGGVGPPGRGPLARGGTAAGAAEDAGNGGIRM